MTVRVTHIATIHAPLDTRIFRKQCRALVAAGYEVHLVVPGPPGDTVDGVRLHSIAANSDRPPARRQGPRFLRATRHALALRPSTFHLHEPHLVPLGVLLKLAGARVVYDVHEDNPAHARTKLHDRPIRGRVKALMWATLERVARRAFDGFVCASPELAGRFPPGRTEVVGNFPLLPDFDTAAATPYGQRPNRVVYTGVVSGIRGFDELMLALDRLPRDLPCHLRLVGRFWPPGLAGAAASLPAWARVEFKPWQSYPEVVQELLEARVGLILLHSLPNHHDAVRSNKLFEYMAAGIPVVASDLPRWREIVDGVGCGLLVDPRDPDAIAAAIEHLLRHPEEAQAMGERGRAAVEEGLNWDGEEARLLALYHRVAGRPAPSPAAVPAVAR
jgi:glycosyltransferase involved in cell wall biosynthesis